MPDDGFAEVFPLIWTKDVGALADWAVATLGLTESWRAPAQGAPAEHVELLWYKGKVSINVDKGAGTGPCGISLRVDDRRIVDQLHERARAAGAEISQGAGAPQESRVAYSFTARDPDGNHWWVNAETGFLDELRT